MYAFKIDYENHDFGKANLLNSRFSLEFNKFYCLLLLTIFTLFLGNNSVLAQTTLINPTTDGGFELGPTFIANGWIESNSINNPWLLGSGGSNAAIAPFANNRAFVSNTAGASASYDVTLTCVNYFYRDVTVPAGETKIILSFNSLSQGESVWDMWQVFTAPTTITPVSTTTYPGNGITLVPAGITGATFVGTSNVASIIPANTVQNIALVLPGSLS